MNKGIAMRRARVVLHGVSLLFLLALIGSCDHDGTGPLEEVASLIVGGDMGAQHQDLTITRQGVAVTDATVTVNAVVLSYAGAGHYVGQLPDAVPAGSALNLHVSAGGATVQGTVTVPEAPVLTAPATGADYSDPGTITVRWTSATDPDRFMVSGAWVVGDVRFGKNFPAAATAREIRIPAREFPAGTDITIRVVAYNDGSFSGHADPDSRMTACGEGAADAAITITTEASPLLILGGVGSQFQSIWIFQGGWAITDGVSDAVVTVNGVTIPHVGGYPGYYKGLLPAAVPPGARLDLRVWARGAIVEATGNVPEVPVLTDAAAGSGSVIIRWTSVTNPDRFVVYVNRNGPVLDREVPGAARELEIAASEMPAGDFTVYVVAYNDGSFSGPADPDSRMGIRSVGGPITIIR